MITRHSIILAPWLLAAACAVPMPVAPHEAGATARAEPVAAAPATSAQEQDYSPKGMFMQYHGDFWLKYHRYEPQVLAGFEGLQRGRVQSEGGRFDMQQYSLDARVPVPVDPDSYLLLGGHGRARHFQFSSAAVGAFDETIWSLGLRLGAGHFLGDDTLLEAEFLPGISTDLDGQLKEDDYQWLGRALLTYRPSQNVFLKIGANVADDFEDLDAYPLLGLSWLLDEAWRFDLLAPKSAELSWSPSTATTLYTGFYLSGDRAHVRTPPSLGKQRLDVRWQEISWRLGGVYRFSDHVSIYADAGTAFAGDYDWRDGMGNSYNGTLRPTLVFSAGMGFDF